MTPEAAIDLFKQVITFALYVIGPFLLTMLLVGLTASLVQSVTSIQEQTLTFAPKVLALAGMLALLAPWLLRTLTDFAVTCFVRMGSVN